jgi:glycosyltransferase involved in cell wall biosynthesis
MKKVLVVGSAEQSCGGVAAVIRLMKQMPVWQEYHCYWLGTQIQRNYLWKLWYAVKANTIALFIVWRYDIVHFHTVPDRQSLIIQLPIFLLARLGRKHILMHIHMGNQLKKHTDNGLFKWCLRRADLIILLAKKWQELFQEQYTDVKTPTTVLYNPCEIVPEVPFEEKEHIIIMAALFNDNKAPDLLLRAWQKVLNDDLNPNLDDNVNHNHNDDFNLNGWKIYMLGNGEVERYRKMAAEMGLADSVTFTGYVTGKEKENIFRRASICCVCSYEEGFPMVVLESWASGICVVTTPVGGLPEVLEDGCNALVFDFGDWQGLSQRLEQLIHDEEKRREMANYARQFVITHFSPQDTNRQLTEFYKRI